jgi:hypothetical protein
LNVFSSHNICSFQVNKASSLKNDPPDECNIETMQVDKQPESTDQFAEELKNSATDEVSVMSSNTESQESELLFDK